MAGQEQLVRGHEAAGHIQQVVKAALDERFGVAARLGTNGEHAVFISAVADRGYPD